jgi:carbamoyl-phosphate synthase large subunit
MRSVSTQRHYEKACKSSHMADRRPPRVCVTGVSGDVGFGCVQALRAAPSLRAFIIGLDSSEDCAGFHFVDVAARIEPVAAPSHLGSLERILIEHSVDILFPGVDSEIPLLAEHKQALEDSTGCRVAVAPPETVRPCVDKMATATWLQQIGIPSPPTLPASAAARAFDDLGTPFVVKPRRGQGSCGFRLVRDPGELDAKALTEDLCLQQYIDGPEYTCGLLFDQQGRLCDAIAMRRELQNGRTVKGHVEMPEAIARLIETFGQRVAATGAINIQLRLNPAGQPVVFEINPRLSGSTAMRVAVGFNDPARLLSNILFDEPIAAARVTPATVYSIAEPFVVPDA